MTTGFGIMVLLFFLATTANAMSFSLSTVTDQASDGNFCNSIYTCSLSDQELSNLNTQDDQGYQIKDHTGLFANGAWPQIYFGPDRYLMFDFEDPNLLSTDTILSSNLTISHQLNEVQGSKGLNYDIKLEISKDNGSTWEVLSTNLWPATPNSYSTSQVSLPASYLNATSLNNLLTRLSIYGDDGYANLSSIIDLVELDIDYYNPLTNSPPVSTISAPNENQVLKGEITFSASATDDFGITEYQLNLLDENQNLVITCLQATIYSTTSISISCQINTNNYSNGQYYLQVKTKDNAGEWSISTRPVVFDNTAPITDLLSILPQDNTFWKDPITISGTSQDNLITSFVDLYFKESDTTDPWTDLTTLVNSVTSSIFNWSYSWQPTQEKTYDLAASATDTASNQEDIQTISEDITYDNTKPSNPTVQDSGVWANHSSLTFSWPTSSDTLSGINHYLFYLSTATNETSSVISSFNIGNITEYTLSADQSSLLLEEVSYHAKVKAVDKAGNIARTYANSWSDGITLDLTSPKLQWEYPEADNLTISGTTTLSSIATDKLSEIKSVTFDYKSIDGHNYTNIATMQELPYSTVWDTSNLPLGDYQVKTMATDNAGNINEIFRNISISSIIGNQTSSTPAFGEIAISWTTQRPTSGRVVYDIFSHQIPNTNHLNYSYAFSSSSINLSPKATSHFITLTSLSDNTIYYYRIISTGSPTTIGPEMTSKTLSLASPGNGSVPDSPPAVIAQSKDFSPVGGRSRAEVSPGVESNSKTEVSPGVAEVEEVLGKTTTEKPKTWMLVLSIFISFSYLLYLLSRRRKI